MPGACIADEDPRAPRALLESKRKLWGILSGLGVRRREGGWRQRVQGGGQEGEGWRAEGWEGGVWRARGWETGSGRRTEVEAEGWREEGAGGDWRVETGGRWGSTEVECERLWAGGRRVEVGGWREVEVKEGCRTEGEV